MKQIKLKQINIRIFSGAVLKYIAMLTMLIDHIGATGLIFLSVGVGMSTRLYFISRMIGRIAFPIYVFLLVEGFVHTKNIKKYIILDMFEPDFILNSNNPLSCKRLIISSIFAIIFFSCDIINSLTG